METTPPPAKHSKLVILAVWLSIWAIIICLGCLYLGFSAQSKVSHAERRLQRNVELLDESRNQIQALDKKIQEELEKNQQIIEQINFSVTRNENRIRANTQKLETTREVASQLIDSLTEQREALTGYSAQVRDVLAEFDEIRTVASEETASVAAEQPPPGSDTVAIESTTSQGTREVRENEYVVQSGDTLSQIARKTGHSVPALLDANPKIDPNLIRVGQSLKLPEE